MQSKTNEKAESANSGNKSWNSESQGLNSRHGWNKELHPLNNIQRDWDKAKGWNSGKQSTNSFPVQNRDENPFWKVPVKESHGNVHSQGPTEGRPITKKSHQ